MKGNADNGVKKVLLMNKMDIPNKELNYAEVKAWCDTEGIDVYETSAKTGRNVNQVFIDLCRHLIVNGTVKSKNPGLSHSLDPAALNAQKPKDEGGCC